MNLLTGIICWVLQKSPNPAVIYNSACLIHQRHEKMLVRDNQNQWILKANQDIHFLNSQVKKYKWCQEIWFYGSWELLHFKNYNVHFPLIFITIDKKIRRLARISLFNTWGIFKIPNYPSYIWSKQRTLTIWKLPSSDRQFAFNYKMLCFKI